MEEHSWWIDDCGKDMCGTCGTTISDSYIDCPDGMGYGLMKYCPYCGRKMDWVNPLTCKQESPCVNKWKYFGTCKLKLGECNMQFGRGHLISDKN